MSERGSCEVCDRLYGPGSSSGVCVECATGEIGHSFQGDDETTCTHVTEYVGGYTEPCWRNKSVHIS